MTHFLPRTAVLTFHVVPGKAKVTDLMARNGVVHVIDTVMLP